ncbi:RHS repeat-associated core domain-containing protein [Treponema pedis]|uniref:RHS repeat-associated core domain-containing protein n=1 Tax=Treponema pedis TaxID=409322 RepID=UPI0012697810
MKINVLIVQISLFNYKETTDNDRITWVFQGFTPVAKIQGDKSYSIISDHIGTPLQAIDTQGNKVWERELDIYGKVRKETEENTNFVPFLFQGQYLDIETDLCYNRFRYYSPETGSYISQDPIGLAGNNPTLYGYVKDSNFWIDPYGLALQNGIPKNPGIVRRFMSKSEYKNFKKNGFKFDPNDSRGGISATSTKVRPMNPDAIKRSTGALGADYYVDIDTRDKNVELKGMTKGGIPDWKIKDDVSPMDIVKSGKVCK